MHQPIQADIIGAMVPMFSPIIAQIQIIQGLIIILLGEIIILTLVQKDTQAPIKALIQRLPTKVTAVQVMEHIGVIEVTK